MIPMQDLFIRVLFLTGGIVIGAGNIDTGGIIVIVAIVWDLILHDKRKTHLAPIKSKNNEELGIGKSK